MSTVQISKFLYPHSSTHNDHLTFPVAESVVGLCVFEDLSVDDIDTLQSTQGHDYFGFLLHLRKDLWSAVRHLGISYDDVWIHLGDTSGLRLADGGGLFFQGLKGGRVGFVVVIQSTKHSEYTSLVVALEPLLNVSRTFQTACQQLRQLLPRFSAKDLRTGHTNSSLGSALDPQSQKTIQRLTYLGSSNTFSEAFQSGKDSTGLRSSKADGHLLADNAATVVHVNQEDIEMFILQRDQAALDEQAHSLERKRQRAVRAQRQKEQREQPYSGDDTRQHAPTNGAADDPTFYRRARNPQSAPTPTSGTSKRIDFAEEDHKHSQQPAGGAGRVTEVTHYDLTQRRKQKPVQPRSRTPSPPQPEPQPTPLSMPSSDYQPPNARNTGLSDGDPAGTSSVGGTVMATTNRSVFRPKVVVQRQGLQNVTITQQATPQRDPYRPTALSTKSAAGQEGDLSPQSTREGSPRHEGGNDFVGSLAGRSVRVVGEDEGSYSRPLTTATRQRYTTTATRQRYRDPLSQSRQSYPDQDYDSVEDGFEYIRPSQRKQEPEQQVQPIIQPRRVNITVRQAPQPEPGPGGRSKRRGDSLYTSQSYIYQSPRAPRYQSEEDDEDSFHQHDRVSRGGNYERRGDRTDYDERRDQHQGRPYEERRWERDGRNSPSRRGRGGDQNWYGDDPNYSSQEFNRYYRHEVEEGPRQPYRRQESSPLPRDRSKMKYYNPEARQFFDVAY